MRRKKALTVALSLVAVCGLVLVLVLLSKPAPAAAYKNYTWKPGCHCGAPATTTTTKRPTTTTTNRPATTTTKAAPKPATTTTVKASTTTATSQTSTTATTVDPSSTSTDGSPPLDSTTDTDQNAGLGVAAGAVGLFGSGGDPPNGSGPGDGSGAVPVDATVIGVNGEQLSMDAFAPQYYVSPLAIVFLLVYGASFLFYRTRLMRVATHRKIWNVLLMITFLITGIFGLILAIGISSNPPLQLPSWLLFWHVETGIVMCFISLFHLGWHAQYYAKMLVPRRRGRRERATASRPFRSETDRSQPAFDYVDEARQVPRPDRYGSRGR